MYKEIEKRLGSKIEEIKVLKSGWAGEIISLKLESNGKKYVIKTYSSSKNGLQNIKQEWKGLNLLYNASYPVPRPIISDFDNEKPYIVMEEIEGDNLWNCYEKGSEESKKELLGKFVKVFFELHSLDISMMGGDTEKDTTVSFVDEEIGEIEKLTIENRLGYFTQIICWLQKGKINVIGGKLSIIHRDYHPWNVIVDKSGEVYVIDLLWGIGDYRFDLAWMCTLMERSGFEDFSHKVLEKYKGLIGKNIHNFDYFKVLATLRWLVNVMISLKTGENLNETRNEEFEKFISPLIQKGIRLIEEITGVQIAI